MTALIILFCLALYLLISGWVVWLATHVAGKFGRRKWPWGIAAALVMYNLVFWDLIPTYVVYKYYVITKAGFWVYKTPEQWQAENPGVAETLTWKDGSDGYTGTGKFSGYEGYKLNERILWISNKQRDPNACLIPVAVSEGLIVDSKNDTVLVRRVVVWTGKSSTEFTRFWTHFWEFSPGFNEYYALEAKYHQIGRKVE